HLSDDAAAIEFIRFDPFDFKATGDEPRLQPARYLAFVLGADTKESPRMIDLGEAEPIERAVAELREHIEAVTRRLRFFNEEGLEEIYRELAGELSGLVFAPLRDALGDARMIYLSPDGELNRIAFEALTAADGSYLIDHYEFAYASSSRDLLRASDKPATGTIVFASPDYDLNDQPAVPGENLLADVTRGAPDYWQGDLSRDTRGLSWDRLPATEGEASRVVEMFAMHDVYGPAHSFLGSDALEGLLKRMQAPRILHLATHGFYLADQQREHPEQSFLDRGLGASTTAADLGRLGKLENPLLRSGIVLAGANRLGEAGGETTETTDDGWVTAEEIGLLNLQGTELVVLSACETGLGDVRTGEGVAGLRRAFLQAGARTLVTSLYKVPDEATQALMIDFYSRLAAGESKLAALRGAQQATIAQRRKENGAAHPFFWASFVLVGDPE
ncbi:MAG: CHAT domain-containing protein, partial [Pirellulales bacterium]